MIENYVQTIRSSVPDGCSVTSEAVQVRNNSLASAIKHLNKITSSFNNLINDEDGQALFEEYAKVNKIDDHLLFWFAIEGFKRRFNELDGKRKRNENYFQTEITHMAKAIYNNFIKNNAKSRVYQWFGKTTRETVYNKIVGNKLDSDIFDDVKNEFEIRIQEEIYPKFLKSDIFVNYSDNLKNNCDPKSGKSNHAKNPYHQSYSHFHPTSTQESECHFNLREDGRESGNESRNLVNLNNGNKIKLDKHVQNGQSADQPTVNRTQQDSSNQLEKSNTNKTSFEQTIYNLDRTLQVLYSTGARSHLPNKPKDDMEKVKNFIAKLEKLQEKIQEKIQKKVHQESREECDPRILKVIEKFEPNGRNSSLRKLIRRDPITVEDSQSILDQHCSRVFSSNYHTKSLNSPGLNTPKKTLKSNAQLENKSNQSIKLPRHDLLFNQQLNQSLNAFNNFSNNSSNNSTGRSLHHHQRPNSNSTIMYQYSDEIPYSIRTDSSAITLKKFKKEIIKRPIGSNQKFRYFFKKKDQLENMYVMEELTDDNEYVPFCDGKVFAKIEIVSIHK